MTRQVIKSSTANAARIFRTGSVPVEAKVATHRLLVKLVHVILDETPVLIDDVGAIADRVKRLTSQLGLLVSPSGYGVSGLVYRAIDSAIFQRRYVSTHHTPAWKKAWLVKQRAERDRRKAAVR